MTRRIEKDLPAWCAEVISSDNFIILDTETTGLGGEIIDLGIITSKGDIVYDGLFKPSCTIEPGAQAVHNITEDMVSGAPLFTDEWPEIYRRIGRKSIITYNADFDSKRLIHTANAHNVTLEDSTWYCLMNEYAKYGNFLRWQKLHIACAALGIDFRQDHRALGDAMAALEIIKAIAKKAEVKM